MSTAGGTRTAAWRTRAAGLDTRWLLIGNVALVALSGAWMASRAVGGWAPVNLGLAVVPLSMALTALATFMAARAPGAHRATRRFWHQVTLAVVLVGVGSTWVTEATMDAASGGLVKAPPGAVPTLAFAILVVMWALLRLPVGSRTRGEWQRVTLDCVTVTLAVALALWHLVLRPQLKAGRDLDTMLSMLLLSVVCVVALVAVTKVMLIGSGPVLTASLRLLALTVLVGGLTSTTAPLIADPRWLGLQPFPTVVDAALVCWAAHRQFRATRSAAVPSRRRRRATRPFSLLPYVGVAATDLLLAVVTWRGDDGVGVVVAGAVAVTAVVVLRQILSFRDNAQLLASVRRHEHSLRHQASHDALTHLPNRARFGEYVSAALAARKPDDTDGVAVLVIDLDDFKLINDTLGHAVGDEVIVAVAGRLSVAVREGEVVARLGGDEFAVLLRDVSDDEVVNVAERLLALLHQPVVTSGHHLLIHASLGAAQASVDDDLDALLRNADIAMYAAKERGKSGFVRFSPDLAARVHAHAEMAAQMRTAIGTDQFYLLYQPIVRLSDGAVVGTEALVRWNHPVRGAIAPVDFIPTAEHTGLIVPLGRWVLQEACRQAAAWHARYGAAAPYSMNVNVAGWQLRDPNFLADVEGSLAASGLPARHLVVEVTETAVLEGPQIAVTLHALRALDIRIALDDFGTAASSLGLLLTCPVTTLKLDRSFVEQITTVERQAAVATAVIHIARALNLHTVAEGIETVEQARLLEELGYPQAQGYLYARPLTPAGLEEMLTATDCLPAGADLDRAPA